MVVQMAPSMAGAAAAKAGASTWTSNAKTATRAIIALRSARAVVVAIVTARARIPILGFRKSAGWAILRRTVQSET